MERKFSYNGNKVLYLIASPIGNLDEFSERAKKICSSMDLIACEDTRNTKKLLSFFNINIPLVSLHEHNEKEMSLKIIEMIKEGKHIAYLSDAGYPGISDPGQILSKACIEAGIPVSVINGSSAFLTALIASGLLTSHFYFHGFLDSKDSKARIELLDLESKKETLIFYEAPHRIIRTLKLLLEKLGDRFTVIGRELTKIHEEFIRGKLNELIQINPETLKGEMVIIVEGKKEIPSEITEKEIIDILKNEKSANTGRDLVDYVSQKYGLQKKKVYSIYNKIKK